MFEITKTPLGPMSMFYPELDRKVIDEVMVRDAYRLRVIAKVFKPKSVFDLGCASGEVAMMARHLWPESVITGLDISFEAVKAAKLNLPGVVFTQGEVGYGIKGRQFLKRFGYPDLLVIDCEGGEVPFFYNIFLNPNSGNGMSGFKVIVGEWHAWPGRRFLEAAFQERFHSYFTCPDQGAGPWSYFWAVRNGIPESKALCEALKIPMRSHTTL